MLRLVFHDAATFDAAAGDGGADASVQFELDRAENFGLKRGWRVIETAQKVTMTTEALPRISLVIDLSAPTLSSHALILAAEVARPWWDVVCCRRALVPDQTWIISCAPLLARRRLWWARQPTARSRQRTLSRWRGRGRCASPAAPTSTSP